MEYTLTIEQTGGSGMLVPGRGFLLNNELTDFSTEYDAADPNRIQPGKRPRSSISPTIVLRNGKPVLALGSPGGSTIITTVTQLLFNRIDRQMSLPDAIADPRARSATPPRSSPSRRSSTPTARCSRPTATRSTRPATRAPARPRSAPRRRSSSAARAAHRGLRAHPPRRRLRPGGPPPLKQLVELVETTRTTRRDLDALDQPRGQIPRILLLRVSWVSSARPSSSSSGGRYIPKRPR